MKKKIQEDYITKAKKREFKNRPRMTVHGKSLLKPNPHAGKFLAKR